MKFNRQNVDQLNTKISITIEKDDYFKDFKEQLNNYKSKAQLKGFRKGKIPMSALIKMYGNGVLVDLVNKKLQENLFKIIKDEKLKTLGEPIPAEEHPKLNINAKDLGDYEFVFDLGLIPEFEVNGIESNNLYDSISIKLSDDDVEEEFLNARKRFGTQEEVDSKIEENDIITINASELEGDDIKEKGWKTDIKVLVKDIADTELKSELLGKAKKYKFKFDIYKIENNAEEDYVRKYLLNIGEDETDVVVGNIYEGKIDKIVRAIPAELNEEFYKKVFPNAEIKTEEEAKQKLKTMIEEQYSQYEKSFARRKLVKDIVALNDMPLPVDFLKRWLVSSDQKITKEQLDENMDHYLNDIKWSVIKNEIVEKYDINPNQNDFKSWQKDKIKAYFQQQGMSTSGMDLDAIVKQSLQDPKNANEAYADFVGEQVFDTIEEKIKYNLELVGKEDFFEKLKEENTKTP